MDLDRLNPQQREAVLHGQSPLLVLAGAGTGKTTVITYRIAHILAARGARPDEICAVTFTNKAAREMRLRAGTLSRLDPRTLDIGTFHGTCGRILRRYGDRVGLGQNFLIYDSDDQLRLVKKCLQDLNIDTQSFSPRVVRAVIEGWKNQGLTPDEVEPSAVDFLQQKAHLVYREYQKRCLDMNAVDFGDMLLRTVMLLRQDEAIRLTLQSRWRYLLVDEYQDTNPVQYKLLKLLVTDTHSLTVVGDDDQSIYRWRGADLGNILRFERDFPGARVIRLEENYRSHQTILNAANAVIANNVSRKGKTLFTGREEGELLRLRLFASERDEGDALAADCEAKLHDGRTPKDFAALYRTNAQSRSIEDALRRRRIPYKIYGGVRFYDRREIKDALAYVRVLVNPSSDVDFLRIINVPARGVGKTSVEKLTRYALERGMSVHDAGVDVVNGAFKLTGKAGKGVSALVSGLEAVRLELDSEKPGRIVEHVLEDSGYLQMLRLEGTEEATERLENLAELIAGIDEYTQQNEEPTLTGFLEEVALATDLDGMDEAEESVSLMTLHSAKGLEYSVVYLPGMEEGLFPHSRSFDDHAQLEEERRLCYVGLTRAKDELILSAARVRSVFGEPRVSELSRFVAEIPENLLEVWSTETGVAMASDVSVASLGGSRSGNYGDTMAPYRSSDPPQPSFGGAGVGGAPSGNGKFSKGTKVNHASFGDGTVLAAEGDGKREKLTIEFPTVGRKVVVARFVELASGSAGGESLDDIPF